ncbi:carnosine N-methyltransferase-like [Hylaeus volcanicus]|uniref:carnosine N-methyltransferase-like n=1 Tax=Hylaeus volcanicus TaxID=313075 RepID=UPI0023B7D7F3|nr:carnosine N-methyltransferase-like [Hylaeus volcanicus]
MNKNRLVPTGDVGENADNNQIFVGSPLEYQAFLKPNVKPEEEIIDACSDEHLEANDSAEEKHLSSVCNFFSKYALHSMNDVARMEENFHSLSNDDQLLLMENITDRIDNIKKCVLANQKFLNLLISDQSQCCHIEQHAESLVNQEESNEDEKTKQKNCTSISSKSVDTSLENCDFYTLKENLKDTCDSEKLEHEISLPNCHLKDTKPNIHHFHNYETSEFIRNNNISKVRSTLRQFVRDWSTDGAAERQTAYLPLLNALEQEIPLKPFIEKNKRLPRVLCPGSGLGRLPFEVAKRGYGCQGNEFSFFMLLGSSFVLNSKIKTNSLTIFPYCLCTSNRMRHEDHLVAVKVPDVCPLDWIQVGHDFSMCAGEFVEVYWEQEKQWDAVLTSFFIDTAKNVFQYIRTIARLLPPGGLWANVGPLLYHFSDMPNEISIEVSYEEIRSVIKKYFTISKESWIKSTYTVNPSSMIQVYYNCIHFIAIRNNIPFEGKSNVVYE